jgi:hypothetical protein
MKTSRAPIAIVLVLTVCTTVFTGCAHVKGSPAPGPYSAAVKAAAGITTGLTAVQQQNEILYTTIVNANGKRLLSRDESLAVANAVVTGFQANDAFISCLKGFKVVGATDAQIISDCFKNLGEHAEPHPGGHHRERERPGRAQRAHARIQFGDRRREHRRPDPRDATAHAGAAGERAGARLRTLCRSKPARSCFRNSFTRK